MALMHCRGGDGIDPRSGGGKRGREIEVRFFCDLVPQMGAWKRNGSEPTISPPVGAGSPGQI
jgi:hypothetical protein